MHGHGHGRDCNLQGFSQLFNSSFMGFELKLRLVDKITAVWESGVLRKWGLGAQKSARGLWALCKALSRKLLYGQEES